MAGLVPAIPVFLRGPAGEMREGPEPLGFPVSVR
jgi:hypothetical protein